MAKKSKRSGLKRLVMIGGTLAAIQIGVLVFMSSEEGPVDVKTAIQKAVSSTKDPRQRLQRQIIISVNSYRVKNKRLPTRLEDLVPEWFDRVPLDPLTNKPFEYRLDNDKFYVGSSSGSAPAGGQTTLLTDKEIDAIISSMESQDATAQFVYDSSGRRDPFTPFDFSVKVSIDTNVPPLQRFSLGQLKLSAVLLSGSEPSAMVETQEGMGYPVKKGTKIGLENGEIIEILADKLMILETTTDFTGAVKRRTVEMPLRTSNDKKSSFSRPSAGAKPKQNRR